MQRSAGKFCVLAAALCFAILIARAPQAVIHPVLHGEDGTILFADSYNGHGLKALFYFYGGYIAILPRLAAYLISFFPTAWMPHLLVLVPMSLTALAFSLFALPVFRKFVASDLQRAAVCVGLAVMPLGNAAKVGVTGYIQWPAGIILCLFILSEAAVSLATVSGVALFAAMVLLIWSNPIAVVLAPLFLYEAFRRRAADRPAALFHLLLFGACALYALFGREASLGVRTTDILGASISTLRAIVERVVYETIDGPHSRLNLIDSRRGYFVYLVAAIVMGGATAALWPRLRENTDFQRFIVKCLYMIGAITLLSAVFRTVDLDTIWGRRYTYIQAALFALILLIAITDRLRFPARRRFAATVSALCVAAWLGWINLRNNDNYQVDAADAARMGAFIDTILEAEKANRDTTLKYARGDWPITIHVRPR